VALHLHRCEILQEGIIPRIAGKPTIDDAETLLKDEVGIFDLITAFQKVLKKLENRREDLREIFEENFTVSDKIDYILQTVSSGAKVSFSSLFLSAASRTEIVVTFLALLELIRLKQLRVTQQATFSVIEIERVGA
jgi:segregation and condensation protein A